MNQPAKEIEPEVEVAMAKRRWLWGAWKWLLGACSCQAALTALVGAGWAYRMAQRSAMKAWWKAAPLSGKRRFRDAARAHPFLQAYEHTPNWIWAQDRSAHRRGLGFVYGLWTNLWLGTRAWFHSLVFLALPSALMMVSWYSGWDNSFTKGYEQFAVGQNLGFLGLFLMAIVMLYLPMAQGRFAVTQDVRSFYDIRLNRRLVCTQWRACLCLVAGYGLAGIPLMAADSLLGLLVAEENGLEPNKLSDLTAEEALGFLQTYFFWWGFYVIAAFVFLRCWAARIYARGLQRALQSGRVSLDQLSENERVALAGIGLDIEPVVERSRVRSFASVAGRFTIGAIAATLLWLGFGLQAHVSQFFNARHELLRWGNQPLVQIPWFQHIPAHLKKGLLEPED